MALPGFRARKGTNRGVVVRERRSSIYLGAGTALRQISLSTGATLTLKRSGKSRRILVRLTLDQFIFWPKLPPKRGIWHKKFKKKFSGVTPRTPSARGGDPVQHPPPARRVAVLGAGAAEGRPLPLRLSGVSPPENFWRFLMPHLAFGGNLGQKIN